MCVFEVATAIRVRVGVVLLRRRQHWLCLERVSRFEPVSTTFYKIDRCADSRGISVFVACLCLRIEHVFRDIVGRTYHSATCSFTGTIRRNSSQRDKLSSLCSPEGIALGRRTLLQQKQSEHACTNTSSNVAAMMRSSGLLGSNSRRCFDGSRGTFGSVADLSLTADPTAGP